MLYNRSGCDGFLPFLPPLQLRIINFSGILFMVQRRMKA
jgi:hypothetical protein